MFFEKIAHQCSKFIEQYHYIRIISEKAAFQTELENVSELIFVKDSKNNRE